MTSKYDSFGRMNQKRRTRTALKAAAAEFVRRGETPTVAQVAEVALVSKSTAYRYFPTQESLIAEVALDVAIAQDMEKVFAAAQSTDTAAARLDAVIRADHVLVTHHERAFRTFLRATLAASTDDVPDVPRRPGNRLRYLAAALEPIRPQLDAEQMQRLVMGLALCVGIESLLVMEDIGGLTSAEAESVKRWVADVLLQAALNEASEKYGRK